MVQSDLKEFIKKAKGREMSVVELIGSADALRAGHKVQDIALLYKTWIDNNRDNPLLYAVLFNYSTVLTDCDDLKGAQACLEESLKLNPEFMPSHINLGRIFERQGFADRSAKQWMTAIDQMTTINGSNIGYKTTALNQLARLLEANSKDDAAKNMLFQSLEIDPHQNEAMQHYLAARQRLCEWPIIVPNERISRERQMAGISPLSMAVYTDDPVLQLACNWAYNKNDIGEPAADDVVTSYWAATESNREGKPLRIGYLSSDLREHAIGYLMAELFELHNRKNVEVFVYYCGIIPDDPMLQRIKGSVDHWLSINDLDDKAAARRIADDGIQILVDVNGYTRDARTKILRLQPAPVIVNWLGFPGSMGSPYHHYIIADNWIIPPDSEKYYSEKVLRLPCYQPNDRKRVIASQRPTRKDAGLPEDAIVYCCFNGSQKITRFTFDRWLSILKRVPKSVLWLLASSEEAQTHLLDYAEKAGIKRSRIIFASKMANSAHLARYPLADLFLDTSPYGAHTTSSDALWMGVPVLTVSGRSFASRVCGSLVVAAGLPELVCNTTEEFVDRAVALGKNLETLAGYRAKLAASRDTCDLFNTPKLAECLEGLYHEMWADYRTGSLPLPDLSNLDIYLEIASHCDHDGTEVMAIKDYEAWWKEKLAARDRYRPINADKRMWTKQAK